MKYRLKMCAGYFVSNVAGRKAGDCSQQEVSNRQDKSVKEDKVDAQITLVYGSFRALGCAHFSSHSYFNVQFKRSLLTPGPTSLTSLTLDGRKQMHAVCGRQSLPPAPPLPCSRLVEIEATAQCASRGRARPNTTRGHRGWRVSRDASFPIPQIPRVSRDP
ncbi:hypothetical protein NDU88_000865 [Pleurodeles waltl]|uniref:Uncharacterized protein n=1 Tax=Pleurodeles waltl TaxID=8319 RepID=A0AAV7TG68_PLEWA|nr:hypothetical protein NDU88_000865 [Pleurodeles waltl]